MAVQPKIKIPISLAEHGQKHQGLIWNRFLHGHPVKRDGDMIVITGKDQSDVPAFSDLQELVVQDGGYFENIKMALTFTQAAVSQPVPEGVPNRTYVVDEQEQVRTWAQWAQDNQQEAIRRVSGAGPNYVLKAADGTKLLNSDQLKAAASTPGVGVIDWSTARAYYSSEDYERV